MKLKYKLRNFFFPRKHSDTIVRIRLNQRLAKACQEKIDEYKKLMTGGILGDSLWEDFEALCDAKEYYIRENLKLKRSI